MRAMSGALAVCLLAGLQLGPAVEASAQVPDPELAPERARLYHAMDRAAAGGLTWLATHQSERGYWQGDVGHKQQDDYLVLHSAAENEARGQGHLGVSALCGLAFLAGGHLPDRGQHGDVVRRTLDYVLRHVAESGLISDGGTRMYSHAFATLFLAEVWGMAGGPEVRQALERAVHIVVDCQNRQGGWRYDPFTPEADLSVTVCQLQALRAARNIGIQVPAQTIDEAVAFVKRARTVGGPSAGLFYYKIEGRGARTKNREFAINAAAVTSLFTAGVFDERLYGPALDFVDREYAVVADYWPTHFYYWYGNYYACQAMFQAGGPRFDTYLERITRDLLRRQERDGRWRNDVGPGDPFATAVACIILQIPKQFLPIFQR
jgi:hypothetical protein